MRQKSNFLLLPSNQECQEQLRKCDSGICFYGSIEEFPIIGFYLYHVTSAGQSSNWTTSGI